jgi:thymidylate synthase
MKQYQDLLQRIIDEGCEKESGRPNMPHVWGIEDGDIRMDLRNGFPLLTTKKMPWKMIVHELLWFLRGETNIKYLVDNNVHIWDGDAYRWYQKFCKDYKIETYLKSPEQFADAIKSIQSQYFTKDGLGYILNHQDDELTAHLNSLGNKNRGHFYMLGDLGKVYGHQWRNQNGVDQIKDIIEGLKRNPYSRYHILDTWNKVDFEDMALPPCHLLYQFIVRPLTFEERVQWMFNDDKNIRRTPEFELELFTKKEKYIEHFDIIKIPKFYLNLNMYQRSCDTFLGVPFNIASMSLLLMIVAKTCNMIPKQSKWSGGDVHLYLDHLPVAKEQINRIPKKLPQMVITKYLKTLDDILALTIDDFELQNYESDDKLFGELHTGYTK